MFSRSRLPTRADALPALATTKGCTAREVANDEYEVTCGRHTFSVGLYIEAFVREESRDAVASAGQRLPNRDEVADDVRD